MKRLLALFIFNILMMGSAYAQAQADVQTLINTQVPITWQAGLSGKAMQNILTNILGTAFTPNGTVTITPPPGTDQGFTVVQTGSQTGTIPGFSAIIPYNSITVTGEGQNANDPSDAVTGLLVEVVTGGPNEGGTKEAVNFLMFHHTATPVNANKGDHIGIRAIAQGDVNDGGTALTAAGSLYGSDIAGVAISGATFLAVVSGGEISAEVRTGSSALHRWGWSMVSRGDLHGSNDDAAIQFGTSGAAKWQNTLLLSNSNGFSPLETTGCVLCTDGSSNAITTGIDLSSYTISGNFLKSVGFVVSGNGFTGVNGFASSQMIFYDWGGVTLVNGLNSDINIGAHTPIRIIGPSGAFSVGGFQQAFGTFSGQVLHLFNTVAQTMTIVNEDASTTAVDRITTLTGGNVVLRANATSFASFIYDTTSTRWILMNTN